MDSGGDSLTSLPAPCRFISAALYVAERAREVEFYGIKRAPL